MLQSLSNTGRFDEGRERLSSMDFVETFGFEKLFLEQVIITFGIRDGKDEL